MSEGKMSLKAEFVKGLVRENPVFRLVLGTCPTLATTTSVQSAFGMGVAAAFVLVCSNVVISALRKVIPSKVRIPAYIVIIATFVSIVQMLVKAFAPAIDKQLGIYLPLIVVNCIILGRAEAFAGKNAVLASAIDGLGMGMGFLGALLCMGLFREALGAGTIAGINILPFGLKPIAVMGLAPGGFFAFGVLMALANHLSSKRGKPRAELSCCGCPLNTICSASGGMDPEKLAPKPKPKPKPAAKPAEKPVAKPVTPTTGQTPVTSSASATSAAQTAQPAAPTTPAESAEPMASAAAPANKLTTEAEKAPDQPSFDKPSAEQGGEA